MRALALLLLAGAVSCGSHAPRPAEEAIERDFRDQPALAADLREATGGVHEALGMYAKAAEILGGVAAQRSAILGADDPLTLRARVAQAGLTRRHIFDLRLALTAQHHGVTQWATRNTRDFEGLGFQRLIDPLADD